MIIVDNKKKFNPGLIFLEERSDGEIIDRQFVFLLNFHLVNNGKVDKQLCEDKSLHAHFDMRKMLSVMLMNSSFSLCDSLRTLVSVLK